MIKIFFLSDWDKFETKKECDWKIIELSITQKEGHIAKAKIKTANFKKIDWRYLGIYKNKELIFQGLINNFVQSSENITQIEVLCIKPNFEDDLRNLIQHTNCNYIAEFFQNQKSSWSDFLETTNQLFCWDKVTGKPNLSDYFKGTRTIYIGNCYVKNSLRLRQVGFPISTCDAVLKIKWTQYLAGHFSVIPYIKRAFPDGIIATFNAENLIQEWPKGNIFFDDNKRNGYKILKSEIALVGKSCSGIFVKNTDNYLSHLQIKHMNGHLKIGWEYAQAREEEYRLKINSNNIGYRKNIFNINISLPNSEKAIFFETSQGKLYLDYLEKLIRTRVKASTRCMEAKFKLDWQIAKEFTLNDSLEINADNFGYEKIEGKIININLECKGIKKIAEVTIAYQVKENISINTTDQKISNEYLKEGFLGDNIKSEDGVKGIIHPILLSKNLVEKVIVKNNINEILEKIRTFKNLEERHIEYIIDNNPTSIEIDFKDLSSDSILKRKFSKIIN